MDNELKIELQKRVDALMSACDTFKYLCESGDKRYEASTGRMDGKLMFYREVNFIEICAAIEREPEFIKYDDDVNQAGELFAYYKGYKLTSYVAHYEVKRVREKLAELFPDLVIEELADEN